MGLTKGSEGERGSKAKLQALKLHSHQEWSEDCADILNEEWPRSKTARLHMLNKSNDQLPYNIVLLEESAADCRTVIGHSRLCKVHGQTDACFVESVVVAKSKRSQGYGRILMEFTEQHALRLGYNILYLTTHDKQDFYHHIGYGYCQPIVSLGSASGLVSDRMMNQLFGKMKDTCQISSSSPGTSSTSSQLSTGAETSILSTDQKIAAPTPPPPPPPPNPSTNKDRPTRMDPNKVSWMKKSLDCQSLEKS